MKKVLMLGIAVLLVVVMVGGILASEKFTTSSEELSSSNEEYEIHYFDTRKILSVVCELNISELENGLIFDCWNYDCFDIPPSESNFVFDIEKESGTPYFHFPIYAWSLDWCNMYNGSERLKRAYLFSRNLFYEGIENRTGFDWKIFALKLTDGLYYSSPFFTESYNTYTQNTYPPLDEGQIETIGNSVPLIGENGNLANIILYELELEYNITSKNITDGYIYFQIYFDDREQRISTLESWKQTIEDWRDSITTTISNIWLAITGHTTRIEALENKTCGSCEGNATFPNYFKYLSSSDRKKMVCGFAEENRLEHIEDLGWNCDLTYRTYSSKRERVTCRCKNI